MRIPRRSTRGVVRRLLRGAGVLGLAAGAVTGGLAAAGGVANASPPTSYHFATLDNSNDPTFNQLLGINNDGVIAGYFGSGMAGHPNKGYYLLQGRTQLDYRIENYPGSAQTQVTGLNDFSTQVGFFAPTNTGMDANFGWYSTDNGRTFQHLFIPYGPKSTPSVAQLLGVNDSNKIVGFYNDAKNNSHGFSYNLNTHVFAFTTIPGATSVTDTAIANTGHIAGIVTIGGSVKSFLEYNPQHIVQFAVPGADMTQAFGVNDHDEVVGVYTVGTATHGFTWTPQGGFTTVDDPRGIGTTTINGVNDFGTLVGFYTDSQNNVDGLVAAAR
jgi:hypothetical protein